MKVLLYEKNIVNNNAKVVKISSQNLKLLQQSLKLEVQPLFLSLGTHRKVVRNHSTASTRNSSTSWTITLVHKLLLGILLLLVMMTQERRHVKRTALKLVLVFVVKFVFEASFCKLTSCRLACVIHPPTLTNVL